MAKIIEVNTDQVINLDQVRYAKFESGKLTITYTTGDVQAFQGQPAAAAWAKIVSLG